MMSTGAVNAVVASGVVVPFARHLCGGSVPEEGKKSNQNVDDGG